MELKGQTILIGAIVLALLLFLGLGCSFSCGGKKEGLLVNADSEYVDNNANSAGLTHIENTPWGYAGAFVNNEGKIVNDFYNNNSGCFNLYACNSGPFYQGRQPFDVYSC